VRLVWKAEDRKPKRSRIFAQSRDDKNFTVQPDFQKYVIGISLAYIFLELLLFSLLLIILCERRKTQNINIEKGQNFKKKIRKIYKILKFFYFFQLIFDPEKVEEEDDFTAWSLPESFYENHPVPIDSLGRKNFRKSNVQGVPTVHV